MQNYLELPKRTEKMDYRYFPHDRVSSKKAKLKWNTKLIKLGRKLIKKSVELLKF